MQRATIIRGIAVTLLALSAPGWAQDEAEPADPNWDGQISVGWSSSRGNSQTDNWSASASAELRRQKDRIFGGADYARSSQKDTTTNQKTTTENWWRLMGQYDYFFQPKWFGFGNGRYETDKIALLDYRLLVGAGVGYQWVETDRTNVALEGGLAYKHETYETPSTGGDDATLLLGYKIDHQIVSTVQFLHDLTYYPVVDDFSDYFVTATAEFRGNFTKNMFSNFKVIYTRDATPAAGRKNSDIKYILGIGWNF
jgi:putative salt-induced outer membrane protein YdiY